MAGRLLEVPSDRATRLLDVVSAQCVQLLVYVYPGWSAESLEAVVRRAGLELLKAEDYVGMAAVRRIRPLAG